jgi:nitroreductase
MDAMQAILTRKSIRKFIDKEVPPDIIKKILEAGIRAPSGGNRQPWRFVVVTDKDKIRQFDPEAHQPWVENAPAIIVACANPHDTWKRYGENDHCYILDTAAAIQNMLLAIHALGLGGVWCLTCGKKEIREVLDIPLHWQIISIIAFGYYRPDDFEELANRTIDNKAVRPRKPLSEVSFINNARISYE